MQAGTHVTYTHTLQYMHMHNAAHTTLTLACTLTSAGAPTSTRPWPLHHTCDQQHLQCMHSATQQPHPPAPPGACSPYPSNVHTCTSHTRTTPTGDTKPPAHLGPGHHARPHAGPAQPTAAQHALCAQRFLGACAGKGRCRRRSRAAHLQARTDGSNKESNSGSFEPRPADCARKRMSARQGSSL